MTSRILLACGIVTICAIAQVGGDDRRGLPTEFRDTLLTTARIEQALRGPARFSYADTPLEEIAKDLQNRYQIPVLLDLVDLNQRGINQDLQITQDADESNLDLALEVLLEPHGMSHVVEHEVLKITTKEIAAATKVTRIYPIRDLVDHRKPADYVPLMELIHESLDDVPGDPFFNSESKGVEAAFVPNARVLVVRHNRKGHRQVEKVLASLRSSRLLPDADHSVPGSRQTDAQK